MFGFGGAKLEKEAFLALQPQAMSLSRPAEFIRHKMRYSFQLNDALKVPQFSKTAANTDH